VFGAAFVLGPLRIRFLVPRVGERAAELLELPVVDARVAAAQQRLVQRCRLAVEAADLLPRERQQVKDRVAAARRGAMSRSIMRTWQRPD